MHKKQRDEALPEIIEQVPELRRNLLSKSYAGEASPRQAIKAKCYECVGFEDIKESVGQCRVWRCPLWEYRPFSSAQASDSSNNND